MARINGGSSCCAHPVLVKKGGSNIRFVCTLKFFIGSYGWPRVLLLPGAQGGFVGDPTSLARDNIKVSWEWYRLIYIQCASETKYTKSDLGWLKKFFFKEKLTSPRGLVFLLKHKRRKWQWIFFFKICFFFVKSNGAGRTLKFEEKKKINIMIVFFLCPKRNANPHGKVTFSEKKKTHHKPS